MKFSSLKHNRFYSLFLSKKAAIIGLCIILIVLPIIVVQNQQEQNTVTKAQTVPSGWPMTPPAQICGNSTILDNGPTTPPPGAVTVPAGDNISMFYDFRDANKTFWFAPGVHTLGTDEFGQIEPGNNTTFIGAPGAILDGQDINRFAFTQKATNVTIRYLTIRNFNAPLDQGVVNHDAGANWTIEYNTIIDNEGAGLMAGSNNIYRYNCMKDNGQYAINACCGEDSEVGDIQNFVVDHNEIVGNNTGDWETKNPGCGCTGGVKFWLNKNVTVTNNWVHDNRGTGLWLDNNNRGFVIEHNYIEENDGNGIFIEAGYDARIRYNNIKRNAISTGREFQSKSDPFPIGAIYISDDGSPEGYGLQTSPMIISNNNFENNWGGVHMWENADRYSGSSAHTHVSGTIKIGDLYSDAQCKSGTSDVIPDSIGDKYKCRWSTENIIVEENDFRIDKAAIGAGCEGGNYCGLNGIFANVGSYPEFSGYTIPWRITFQQGNIFRNNNYYGDWKFAGFQTTKPDGSRVTWAEWTAPAPGIPSVFTNDNRPTTFGQDAGSTYNGGAPVDTPVPGAPTSTPIPPAPTENAFDINTSTLEGTIGKWVSWFSSSVSRSNEEAHNGSYSLKVDVTAPDGWGVETSVSPGFASSPGNKTISFWGKLGTGNVTRATMEFKWLDSSNTLLSTDTVALNPLTTTWQQATLSVDAPSGTATVAITIAGPGSAGSSLYLDDFILADTPLPTVTPQPTATSVPTATPEPTSTPIPTATPQPTATSVPTPTDEPEPTSTENTPIPPTETPIPQPSLTNTFDKNSADFEGSLGKWTKWYSAVISRSNAQAHSGSQSMQVKITAASGWGVQLSNWPGYAATPGKKTLRFWGRKGNGPNIGAAMKVQWLNSSKKVLRTNQLAIPSLPANWKKVEATVTAPAGTTSVYVTFNGKGKEGTVFYLDDIMISK